MKWNLTKRHMSVKKERKKKRWEQKGKCIKIYIKKDRNKIFEERNHSENKENAFILKNRN